MYDIDCGNKVSLGRGVEQSRQSYPVFRSASDRFGKGSFLDTGKPQARTRNSLYSATVAYWGCMLRSAPVFRAGSTTLTRATK